ncbi:MAG: hypothetical protein OEY15_13720, partial [Myxococcales bacterium]|nr:hypothetical protein [Myxococcales bacterium]
LGCCAGSSAPRSETGAAGHSAGMPEAPEPTSYFDPQPLPDAPRFVLMASYWLPIAVEETAAPQWFRLHAYLDTGALAERLVLTRGSLREPLVRIQRDALLDRLAGDAAVAAKRDWLDVLRQMVSHGGGCAVLLPPELEAVGPVLPDEAALALVAHHVKGRRACLLLDAPDAHVVQLDCADKLRRCGLTLEAPRVLGQAD